MRCGGARFHKQHSISPPQQAADLGKKRNEIRKRFLSEKISRRRNRRNQFRYYTLTLLAFCLTITTYLCTIPFATSFLATFKSKFASPLEEPSNFTFPTDAALTQNFDGVALLVVVAEEVAVLLFKDWPLNDAHKLCMFAVDAVKDIFACVCVYFYCCFRTTKSDDDFSFFPLSLSPFTDNNTLSSSFFAFFLPFLCSVLFLPSLLMSSSSKKKRRRRMKQTTTATVLADNTANVPTTLVSYLQRLKALDETSASVSDKVHSEVESFVLALETTKTTTGKDDTNNNNNNKKRKLNDVDEDEQDDDDDDEESRKKKKQLLEERIDKSVKLCLEIADEKCALAARAYDLVDEHITKLDKDLRVFEDEARNNTNANPKNKPNAQGGQNDKKNDQVGSPYYVNEADPNEPTYCYCKRVSFGEMVGCENDKCKIEWFHFSCVGLDPTVKLKGKWYCKECKLNMKLKKK